MLTSPAVAPETAAELKLILESERAGSPYVLWRDSRGLLCQRRLENLGLLTIGRRSSTDICLAGDGEVSRLHARLELLGGDWTVADDGLSRNGTFVNEQRVRARHRLQDGDVLRLGSCVIQFRDPRRSSTPATLPGDSAALVESLTAAQLRVLTALCRPYTERGQVPRPATNAEIAAEVFLGVDAVKAQLRNLYRRFGLERIPQNAKRKHLASEAMRKGLVRRGR
jgi:hypothetical protein